MFTFTPATKELKPGQYTRAPGIRSEIIRVCCPNCEGDYRLARQYVVGSDGTLNPDLHCPLLDCDWKQSAKLGRWVP